MEDDDDETDNENGAEDDEDVSDRVSQMLDNQKCYIQMCKNSSQILQMLSQFNPGVSCTTQVLELQSVSEESDSSRSSTSSASSSPTSLSDKPPLVIWAEPIMSCQLISTPNQGCEGVRRLPPGFRPGENKGKVSPENCSSTSAASSKKTVSPALDSTTQQMANRRDPDTKFSTQTDFSEAMMKISKAADTIRQARQMLANVNELNNNNDPDQYKEINDSSHSDQANAVISSSATRATLQSKPVQSQQVDDDDAPSRSEANFPEPILVKTAMSPTNENSCTDAECSVTPKTVSDHSRALSFTDSGISRSTSNFPSRVNEIQSSESARSIERFPMSRLRANLFAERMGWSSNMSQHALQASRIVRYPRTYGPICRRQTTNASSTEHTNRTQLISSLMGSNNQGQNLDAPQATSPSEPPPKKIRIPNSRHASISESDPRDPPHKGGGDVPEKLEKLNVSKVVHKITINDLKKALDLVIKNLGKTEIWSTNLKNLHDPQVAKSKVGSNGFILSPFDFTCATTEFNNVVTLDNNNVDDTLGVLPAVTDCQESPVYAYEAVCDGREQAVSPSRSNLESSSHSRIWEGGGRQNPSEQKNVERDHELACERSHEKICCSETNGCDGENGDVCIITSNKQVIETERSLAVLENEGELRSQISDTRTYTPFGIHEECGDSASCEMNSPSLVKCISFGINEGVGDVSEKYNDARSRVPGGDGSAALDGSGLDSQPRSLRPDSEIDPSHFSTAPDHTMAGIVETASPDFVFGRHDYLFREAQWPTGLNHPTQVPQVNKLIPVSIDHDSSSTDVGDAEITLKVVSSENQAGEPRKLAQGFQLRGEAGQKRPGSAWREGRDDTYVADRSALESENECDSAEESSQQIKEIPFYVGKIMGDQIIDCSSSIADAMKASSVKSEHFIAEDKPRQVWLTVESGDNLFAIGEPEDELVTQENNKINEGGEEGGSPDASEASSVTVKSVSIGMSISSAIKGFVDRRRVRRRPIRKHFRDRNISEFSARHAELENETTVAKRLIEAGSEAVKEEKLVQLPNTCVVREMSNIFLTADNTLETSHIFVSRSGTILRSILSRQKSPKLVPVSSLRDIEETDQADAESDVINLPKPSPERKVTWDTVSKGSSDHVIPTAPTSPTFTRQTDFVTSHEDSNTPVPPPPKPGLFDRIRRLLKACIPSWGR